MPSNLCRCSSFPVASRSTYCEFKSRKKRAIRYDLRNLRWGGTALCWRHDIGVGAAGWSCDPGIVVLCLCSGRCMFGWCNIPTSLAGSRPSQ